MPVCSHPLICSSTRLAKCNLNCELAERKLNARLSDRVARSACVSTSPVCICPEAPHLLMVLERKFPWMQGNLTAKDYLIINMFAYLMRAEEYLPQIVSK
jgi:hypothetical protein